MNLDALYSELTLKPTAKVALVVLDGVGDIATPEQGYLTPLEAAVTPNLDALAKDSAQGRMIPIAPGITPGSGPGHIGLFGYDPQVFQVGHVSDIDHHLRQLAFIIENRRAGKTEELGAGEELFDGLVVLAELGAVAFVEDEDHPLIA